VNRAAQYPASWADLYFPSEQSQRGVEIRLSLPQIQSKFIECPKPRSKLVGRVSRFVPLVLQLSVNSAKFGERCSQLQKGCFAHIRRQGNHDGTESAGNS
jgi:hypothetical protein